MREDLRQKAIAVERGEGKTKVSRLLNISRNTLDLWLSKREVGNCRAISRDAVTKSQTGSGFVNLPTSIDPRPNGSPISDALHWI